MRRIIIWLAATAVAVALLSGYQLGFASTGEEGKGSAPCPTATASASASTQAPEATQCGPAGSADRPGGDTSVHEDKPGESK